MTEDERKLLVEVSMGLAMLAMKIAEGANIDELRRISDRYLERTVDLTMRVSEEGKISPPPAAA
jgi:hypothetical protein